ncbi:hypothetical protein MMC06_003272 [Schaereria dolodes]|nr:hypothetical protein [Schaereria dolodes]
MTVLAHYPRKSSPSSSHFDYHAISISPPTSSIPESFTVPYSASTSSSLSNGTSSKYTPDRHSRSGPLSPEHHLAQDLSESQYMHLGPYYDPPIRVQRSTPSPHSHPLEDVYPTVGEEGTLLRQPWNHFGSDLHLGTVDNQHLSDAQNRRISHKRFSSGSSIGSTGPASPHTPSSAYPQIIDLDTQSYPSPGFGSFEGLNQALGSYSKPVPSLSQADYQLPFLAPAFQHYHPSACNAESHMAAQTAMRQALLVHQSSDMGSELNSMPKDVYSEGCNSGLKTPTDARSNVPKLDRTMSDIYEDELYYPSSGASAQPSQARSIHTQPTLLSPRNAIFSERLQAANNGHLSARSASPAVSTPRERSPFRPGAPESTIEGVYSSPGPTSPAPRLGSAAQMRERQKAKADAEALARHQPPSNDDLVAPRTISPKEAYLDYKETDEDVKMPLFPQETSKLRVNTNTNNGGQFSSVNSIKQETPQDDGADSATERNYNTVATNRRQSSSDVSTSSDQTPPGSSFTFAPPSIPGNVQVPQQYPFISQSRRQSSLRSSSDQVPEFPSHLTSMESTKSENGYKSANSYKSDNGTRTDNDHSESSPDVQRPANTMADTGTYTCTYHGCALRFETPAKLQRHKREGHRQSTPHTAQQSPSSAISHNMSSASAANRNSQAGPHKCERINPSTGKPCNSIFSRPYDLTRHEDTIHNARKQKVRCQLCTEEKTFSRNDALTRHMRVVHPEVDFPGKTKRRGGN